MKTLIAVWLVYAMVTSCHSERLTSTGTLNDENGGVPMGNNGNNMDDACDMSQYTCLICPALPSNCEYRSSASAPKCASGGRDCVIECGKVICE